MRSSVRNAVILLVTLWATMGSASVQTRMTDPLLGLSFDPRTVRFEQWRDSATTRREMGPEPKWVFACTSGDGGRYCVVAGHRRVQSERGTGVLEPDFGGVVLQQGQTQTVLGVPDRLFGEKAIVSPAVRNRLMRDAVSRFIKAFGSAAALQAQLATQGVTANVVPGPLREALESAGVRVPAAKSRAESVTHSPGAGLVTSR